MDSDLEYSCSVYSCSVPDSNDGVNFYGSVDETDEIVDKYTCGDAFGTQAYFYTFEDINGLFMTLFADFYVEEDPEEDMLYLEDMPLNVCVSLDSGQDTVRVPEEKGEVPPIAAEFDKGVESEAKEADGTLRHFRDSRFLLNNMSDCALLPIGKSVNRKEIAAKHEGVDFAIGYVDREATGWALPLTTDAEVLDTLKEQYPGWRLPTETDLSMFMKKKKKNSSKGNGGGGCVEGVEVFLSKQQLAQAAGAAPNSGGMPHVSSAVCRDLSACMLSVERLLKCVEDAGGWHNAVFVAFDVEAFAIASGGIPLPAEFAFLSAVADVSPPFTTQSSSGGADGNCAPLLTNECTHFFSHPGLVCEKERVLYSCLCIHGIPISNAAFLSKDYAALATWISRTYMEDPRVILINKGSETSPCVLDVQALRWLFGAAMISQAEYGRQAEEMAIEAIPCPGDIRCFDISVLEKSLKHSFPDITADASISAYSPHREASGAADCWYHEKLRATWQHQDDETGGATLHCAFSDAGVLCNRIKANLAAFQIVKE